MLPELIKLFQRDLDTLKKEVQSFREEGDLWRTTGSIKNPAGNLCLHLVGNLNNYVGKNIGGTGYVRDRDAEFALKNIPKEILLQKIEETKEVVGAALAKLRPSQLEETYVEDVFGYKMSNGFFLLHLLAHLSYHLGQVNYIRRFYE